MANTNIPNDPIILLSFINTKLRDHYSSLNTLCDDLELDEHEIIHKLSCIGYTYQSEQNRFA